MKRRILSVALALSLVLGLGAGAGAQAPEVTDNRNSNIYGVWSRPVYSYLYANGAGLTRVELAGKSVLVEDYNAAFQLMERRNVERELSIFGGFFAGENYNFLFFGEPNRDEREDAEVIRVVRYDKSWNRLDAASIRGANTTEPFNAGSLRCAEYGGYLYVRTSHEMFTSSDGLNHQANVTFVLRERDMAVTDSLFEVSNSSRGYVSHSFNQFILVDSRGRVVTADHGDAYPRSIVLMEYSRRAGQDKLLPGSYWETAIDAQVDVVSFPGAIGANTTGASLGGLAEVEGGYLLTYNYQPQGDEVRNIYLALVAGGEVTTHTLSAGVSCATPVLAPVDAQGGYVLWVERENWSYKDTVCYAHYGADGTPGEAREVPGALSDCQPIPYAGGVVWYVSDGAAVTFYTLDGTGLTAHPAGEYEPPSDWAAEEVAWGEARGIVPADLRADYRKDITREEFCRVMMAVVEQWLGGTSLEEFIAGRGASLETPFTDSDHPAVAQAYALGVVNGSSATTFSPQRTLTRQEAATMLARAAVEVAGAVPAAGLDFVDGERIDGWAKRSVEQVSGFVTADGRAVMGGTGGGYFSPLQVYTREEAYLSAVRLLRCLLGE